MSLTVRITPIGPAPFPADAYALERGPDGAWVVLFRSADLATLRVAVPRNVAEALGRDLRAGK